MSLKCWEKSRCWIEIINQLNIFFKNYDEIKTLKFSWLTLIGGTFIGQILGREKEPQKKRSEMQGMFIKENSKYVDKSKQNINCRK